MYRAVSHLLRHALLYALSLTAQSARVSSQSPHHRRLGCLYDGDCPGLSPCPASVVSLSRPACRLSTTPQTHAQWPSPPPMGGQTQQVFRTPSKRTVRRRLKRLQAEAQDSPAQAVVARLLAKVPQLMPAVGSTWRPTTSNAAERFLGAFDRFYRAKGPFQTPPRLRSMWPCSC